MICTKKAYFNWSSGKDSALALYHAQKDDTLSIDRLITTVSARYDRVSMHGLSRAMLEAQTHAIDIPLQTIAIPEDVSMQSYNSIMDETMRRLKAHGYETAVFGDIFLEDLRSYREQRLAAQSIEAVFPLWKRDTRALAEEFWRLGFRAVVVCIDCSRLDTSFLGVEWTPQWVDRLPAGVDPCGERGEFHTFCFDGPIFRHSVSHRVGDTVLRTYPNPSGDANQSPASFAFCDLALP